MEDYGQWNCKNYMDIKKQIIVVTGNVVNKVFRIGDSWVWNGFGSPWG